MDLWDSLTEFQKLNCREVLLNIQIAPTEIDYELGSLLPNYS